MICVLQEKPKSGRNICVTVCSDSYVTLLIIVQESDCI